MMLEIAVGDAYGAGFEYIPRDVIERENDLSHFRMHEKHKLQPGTYTDDTQMSLAIAELLADGSLWDWNRENIASKFVEVFKRDERDGYSRAFQAFLESVNSGEEFLRMIIPDSEKSGAAMRAGPIGFLPDVQDVMHYSAIQASLTHDTPLGTRAAVASSLMSHYFIYSRGDKKDLGKWLEALVPGEWDKDWVGKIGEKGFMDVRAAVTAIKKHDRLSNILREVVNFRGDTDTTAAIAMAAASNSREIVQDLPKHLIDGLENGKYGRDYLIELDRKLKDKYRGK